MIPYVISVAHPDYKRPYLSQDFGVIKEEEIDTYFLDEVSEFILERTDKNNLKCEHDIETFFYSYFDEYYMGNSPWGAIVFRNGEWEYVTPSYEKIWEHIQLLKLQEKEDMEKEEEQDENKMKSKNKMKNKMKSKNKKKLI